MNKLNLCSLPFRLRGEKGKKEGNGHGWEDGEANGCGRKETKAKVVDNVSSSGAGILF